MTESAFHRLSAALSTTYDIHRELGGGGMSRVFLATERTLGRDVVIKTLPTDIMSPDAVERFMREIRTAARLQHPNIVPLLSAGEADGVPYYTMPWVAGASLRERLQRGPVPLNEAIAILRDMARALAAAHAKGIVHRDIKPENVLLSSGAALITDFGVARALTEATNPTASGGTFHTGTGISVGTPAYMSPEQFAADPAADHHADLYAWGVAAYELLTGHHPFEGAHGSALLHAHLSTTPAAVSTLAPAVPRSVEEIVRQCLEKDPSQRPSSAQELVDALETTATPAPRGARVSRSRSRIGLGALALALVAMAIVIVMRRNPSSTRDERMIAIAPFRVGGAAADVHYLREGLGDLMTPQLHSIPGVSAPSMRALLDRWRRASGSAEADLSEDQAIKVAAATGAGQLILGEIVGAASHLTINAQLVRVSDGHVLAPAKVEGPADSAAALAARLVATLLSIRDGATVEMVRSMVSANPEAITPFLAGEQAYRHGRYGEAAHSFATAYEHDTTFALAAERASLANAWSFSNVVPGPWLERAWRNRARLKGGDATLLAAVTGASYPAPRPRRQYERELWQAAEQANTAELWYLAADVRYHDHSLTGDTLDGTRVLEAFKRAEALDSSFAPALEHQMSLYLALGDTARARAAWNRQRMLDSTGDFFLLTDQVFKTVMGTEAQALQSYRDYDRRVEHPLPFVPMLLSSDSDTPMNDNRRLPLIDEFMRITAARRSPFSSDPTSALMWNSIGINTGRPQSFAIAPGKDSALMVNVLNVLAALVWEGDSASGARSATELASWGATRQDSGASPLRSTGYFTLGLLALSHGDTAGVERARASLRSLRAPPATPWALSTSTLQEKLLAAHLAVARKAPDARSRLDQLDTLLIDSPADFDFAINIGNLLVSRLWESVGDDRRAWSAATRRYLGPGGSAFASMRLLARARIGERLGRRDDAIAALRTFVALRAKADRSHQPEVAEARARLARLEANTSGR